MISTIAALKAAAPFAVSIALCLLTVGAIASYVASAEREFDPLFGSVFKAGSIVRWRLEGNGVSYWTSHGIRRSELPSKSQGAPILLVGNSFTEATQVNDAEHYGHILEQYLASKGRHSPVLSYGRAGASIADYIHSAPQLMSVFQPGWVVVQVDAKDFTSRGWTKMDPGFARFVRLPNSDTISIIQAPESKPTRSFLGRTALTISSQFRDVVPKSLFQFRLKEFDKWVQNEKPWFHADTPTVGEVSSEIRISDYPVGEEMRLLAMAFDHRLTLLYLPPFDPRSPASEGELELYFRILAESNGVHFVSLRSKFSEIALMGHSPYGFSNSTFNFGHWNAYGHLAAAQVLFDDLMALKDGIH